MADDGGQSGFVASMTLPISWGADILTGCVLVMFGFTSLSSSSIVGPLTEFRDDRVWDEKCVITDSRDGLRRELEGGVIGLETLDGFSSRSRKASRASRVSFFLNNASSCRPDKLRPCLSLSTAIWRERTRPDCIRMAIRESLFKAISGVANGS